MRRARPVCGSNTSTLARTDGRARAPAWRGRRPPPRRARISAGAAIRRRRRRDPDEAAGPVIEQLRGRRDSADDLAALGWARSRPATAAVRRPRCRRPERPHVADGAPQRARCASSSSPNRAGRTQRALEPAMRNGRTDGRHPFDPQQRSRRSVAAEPVETRRQVVGQMRGAGDARRAIPSPPPWRRPRVASSRPNSAPASPRSRGRGSTLSGDLGHDRRACPRSPPAACTGRSR